MRRGGQGRGGGEEGRRGGGEEGGREGREGGGVTRYLYALETVSSVLSRFQILRSYTLLL